LAAALKKMLIFRLSLMQAMTRAGAFIALVQNGKIEFPLHQLDVEKGRIFDVLGAILKLRPARISNFRLYYWLSRAHFDFGGPPSTD